MLAGRLPPGAEGVHHRRELIAAFVRRDLIVRYEHAVLGIAWALGVPLLQMGVFAMVFTRVAPIHTSIPYPLYAFAGLTVWAFFSSAVRTATRSLSDQAALVSKVYFPREVIPLAAVVVSLVDFAVTLVPLVVLMAWYGVRPDWSVLWLPLVVTMLFLFTAGLALTLAIANLFYRDVQHVVEAVLLLWMFATSVVYPVDRIGGPIGTLLSLNPLTAIVDAYRACLFGGPMPSVSGMLWSAGLTAVLLGIGGWLFQRAEHLVGELA
jgi:lipopolysaccharide transport system permease protein